MRKEIDGDFLVVDHRVGAASETSFLDEIPGAAIYEVIQIREKTPLFFEEHMTRFKKSAELSGFEFRKPECEIREEIGWLIEKNRRDHIHVKLLYTRTAGEDCFVAHFMPLERPVEKPGINGVHAILFPGERTTPNIKTVKGSFRQRVRDAREKTGAFEALLTDENGFITEGSRSNIFFVRKSGVVCTPPTGRVLAGVTRDKVMKIFDGLKVSVEESLVHSGELSDIAGAFITGTTVDVSPVGSIDETRLDSAEIPLIDTVVNAYEREMEKYVLENSGKWS